jgi:hypothetical protein
LSLEVARQQFAEMPKETQSRDTFWDERTPISEISSIDIC